jgi:hypothetical protein
MPISINDVLNATAFRQSFDELGELKFWPITAGDLSQLQEVLVRPETLSAQDLVREVILLVGTRINSENEKERGARIERPELNSITDQDAERFSQEYVLRHPELIFKEAKKANGLSESERLQHADLKKNEAETFTQYLARALEDYHKRQVAQLAKTLSGAQAIAPIAQTIADSMNRYREFHEALRVSPAIAESIRALSGIAGKGFLLNESIAQLSRNVVGSLRAFELQNAANLKAIAQVAASFQAQQALASSKLIQAVAASALNYEQLGKLAANALASSANAQVHMASQLANVQPALEALRHTYLGDIAAHAGQVYDEGDEKILVQLEILISEKVNDKRQSSVTRVDLIIIIVAILTLLFQYKAYLLQLEALDLQKQQIKDGQVDQQFQKEMWSRLVQSTETLLEKANKGDGTDRTYTVDRAAELKLRPKFQSRTIGILVKGMSVRIIPPEERDQKYHQWLRVEALDPYTGLPQYGWVSKKYLTRSLKN